MEQSEQDSNQVKKYEQQAISKVYIYIYIYLLFIFNCNVCIIGIVWADLYEIMKHNTSATLTPTAVDLTSSIFANNEINLEDHDSAAFDEY